ncbi:hypothetical protein SLEP1_g25513 [Rubroshorea leprosula]|uniref:Uncharacterized protein n=1 Tax=Rubroshorea leprosula TaxID=152421 RepID=A0AAV5JUU7_9ROSI|nr:hypothetical protein SLEP1_g25513 [Rubroshorea leprosula]
MLSSCLQATLEKDNFKDLVLSFTLGNSSQANVSITVDFVFEISIQSRRSSNLAS